MEKFTKEQAIEFSQSGKWKDLSYREKAALQLHQKLLCMPFNVFHEAIEKALDRPVYTHEFGLNWDGLIAELLGLASKPTLEDIIDLIPKDKQIIVVS